MSQKSASFAVKRSGMPPGLAGRCQAVFLGCIGHFIQGFCSQAILRAISANSAILGASQAPAGVICWGRNCLLPKGNLREGEPMPESYSTTQAAKLVGVSGATLRNILGGQFAGHYAGLFSAGASPGSGEARRLTSRDVLLLRFIRDSTRHGLPHAEIAAKIRAGALEGWEPPTEEAEPEEEPRRSSRVEAQPEGMQSAALVLASQVAQMLESYRSAEARLWDRIAEAEAAQAAAEARAEAAELELARVRRPWYRRLFGGA